MSSMIRIPVSILASTLFALPAAAGISGSGISSINGTTDIELDVGGSRAGLFALDFDEAELNVSARDDDLPGGLLWSDISQAGVYLGPTAGLISANTEFQASDQFFSYRQSVSASGSVAEGDQLAGNYRGRADFFVLFDAPTLVDIVIRLEVSEPLMINDASAFVRVSGIDGQGPVDLEFNHGDPAGIQEFSIRTTTNPQRGVSFDFITDLGLNPDQGFPIEFGGIELFGSITVVPTPGALLILSAAGILAARRRR